MKKYPQITNIILGASRRAGMDATELSKAIGMKPETFRKCRAVNPGSWRMSEWMILERHVPFLPEELEQIERIRKGGDLRK